eukprot:COSAG05_NODE_1298_length_5245_cov_2.350107_2_plen_87_part_00
MIFIKNQWCMMSKVGALQQQEENVGQAAAAGADAHDAVRFQTLPNAYTQTHANACTIRIVCIFRSYASNPCKFEKQRLLTECGAVG